MTYIPTIPNASDIPSQSHPQLRTNFTQIDTVFAQNHVPLTYGTVADRGKHKYVQFFTQGGPPATAGMSALYSKTYGGQASLYWKQGGGAEIRLIGPDPAMTSATNGYSPLPGGLLLQWGQNFVANNLGTTINFSVAFSGAPYVVVPNILTAAVGTPVAVNVIEGLTTNANFAVLHQSTAGHLVHWVAIGPK
jgi:hypothetical protein